MDNIIQTDIDKMIEETFRSSLSSATSDVLKELVNDKSLINKLVYNMTKDCLKNALVKAFDKNNSFHFERGIQRAIEEKVCDVIKSNITLTISLDNK